MLRHDIEMILIELGERVSWRLQTQPRDERWFAGLWR